MLPWIIIIAMLGLLLLFVEILMPGFGLFGILGTQYRAPAWEQTTAPQVTSRTDTKAYRQVRKSATLPAADRR